MSEQESRYSEEIAALREELAALRDELLRGRISRLSRAVRQAATG